MSAGFDGHKKDDLNLGYLGITEPDYEWLTRELVKVANSCCDGRIVSALEGGYRIQGRIVSAFGRSVAAHVRALAEPGTAVRWRIICINVCVVMCGIAVVCSFVRVVICFRECELLTRRQAPSQENAHVRPLFHSLCCCLPLLCWWACGVVSHNLRCHVAYVQAGQFRKDVPRCG